MRGFDKVIINKNKEVFCRGNFNASGNSITFNGDVNELYLLVRKTLRSKTPITMIELIKNGETIKLANVRYGNLNGVPNSFTISQ